jgi:hypothetical protein
VSRTIPAIGLAAATAAVATAVLLPISAAGADNSCVAWGTLPARVVLDPNGATVRTSLHGTAACTGVSFDNGGSAVLRGPGANNETPLRWMRFGATDEATYYPSLNRPGTYRVIDGRTQSYDADEDRIPSSWRSTTTVVKYKSRFTAVRRSGAGITATLQAYGRIGWQAQRHVKVVLQRRTASGTWHTVARGQTSGGGRVHLAARISASADYRLVSAAGTDAWGASRILSANRAGLPPSCPGVPLSFRRDAGTTRSGTEATTLRWRRLPRRGAPGVRAGDERPPVRPRRIVPPAAAHPRGRFLTVPVGRRGHQGGDDRELLRGRRAADNPQGRNVGHGCSPSCIGA